MVDALRQAVEGGLECKGGADDPRDHRHIGVLSADPEFETLIASL